MDNPAPNTPTPIPFGKTYTEKRIDRSMDINNAWNLVCSMMTQEMSFDRARIEFRKAYRVVKEETDRVREEEL